MSNTDIFPINGTDYIEFYVGNSKQAAIYYQAGLGFKLVAYRGPLTGVPDRESFVVQQGKIRFILTSALSRDHEIARHVDKHGDGVKDLALWVDDATKSFETAIARGAKIAYEPYTLSDEHGSVTLSAIKTYGETIHTFVERKDYKGLFLPGFIKKENERDDLDCGLKVVDHCVGNVGWGQMDVWTAFYKEVMGFNLLVTFDDKDISTKYTALMSKVVANTSGNGYIKFPINEPAKGIKKSQIEEYLDFYDGAGVQHIALMTHDIIYTIERLRKNGIEFLYVPDNYYDTVSERVGIIDEDLEVLKKLNILIDRDEEGYLLQLFTKPVMNRPTVFFEIIQRKGAESFGKGNFQALFESIEREQALRGTL